jgi:hypothetical protein
MVKAAEKTNDVETPPQDVIETPPDPVMFGNEMPGPQVPSYGPGQPPLKPRAEVKDAATAEAWLAEAKEIERVLLLGDHASPITTAQLMLEAIPVIEGLIPAAKKRKENDDK